MVEPRKLMKSPKSMDLDITSRCNLKCKYCFQRTSPTDTKTELPTEEWMAFCGELGDCAVMSVCIGGGEPFIRDDLLEIIDAVIENRMRFSILSNGGLIRPEHAEYIASTGRCDYVQISVDGSCPETHDSLRGSGSFEAAMRGVRTLQDAGVPITSRITIHRYNLDDLENTVHLLLDEIGMPSISTNSTCYLGVARKNPDEVALTPAEFCDAMERSLIIAEQYPRRISAADGPLALGRTFQEMEKARAEGRAIPGRGYLTGCGCMWSKLAVRPDGVIVPCNMLAHIGLGRMNRDLLLRIWQDNPELNRLRNRYTIPLSTFSECADCPWQLTCSGNCPASSYTRTGNVFAPSPDGCLKRFLEHGGRIIRFPQSTWKRA